MVHNIDILHAQELANREEEEQRDKRETENYASTENSNSDVDELTQLWQSLSDLSSSSMDAREDVLSDVKNAEMKVKTFL